MMAAEAKRLSQLVLTDPLAKLRVEDEHHRTLADALALAVDTKDASTRSHSQTVSTLCAVIETELGFEPEEVSRIRLAGLLHDVGKIGIPDAILKKPAKLNVEEYEKMKTHSVLGHNIVQAADMPIEADWVLHHHERIDGGGYPDGLAGQDIPLESRIIHVADAFEAMTSDRPYRVAPGEQFAVGELQRNVDTQFDSDVVAALLRALDDRPEGVSITHPADVASTPSPVAPRYVDVHALTSSGGGPTGRRPRGG
jgi:putative nucleotidyltransferase with HDIG domain